MNDNSEHEPKPLTKKVERFFSHPSLNGWGIIIGLVGLLLAIFTWWDSRSAPLLTAQLQSTRSIIVSPTGAENLTISVNGKEIKGPVTAVQIAVWNAGKQPIRFSEDILEPIIIQTIGGTPIISAELLRKTRDVNDFKINDSKISDGILGVSFRILEKDDGGLIQVIYMGDDQIVFSGKGTIVRQGQFELIDNPPKKKEKQSTSPIDPWVRILVGAAAVILIAYWFYSISLRSLVLNVRRAREFLAEKENLEKKEKRSEAMKITAVLAIDIGVISAFIYFFLPIAIDILTHNTPPFSFQ